MSDLLLKRIITASNNFEQLNPIAQLQQMKKLSSEEELYIILGGYYKSIREIADMIGKTVFPGYDHLQNAAIVHMNMYYASIDRYSKEQNRQTVASSLATFFILLAASEHDLNVEVNRVNKNRNLWAEHLDVRVNGVDFRKACMEAVKTEGPGTYGPGIYIDKKPIVAAYKKATGIDLQEKGWDDFFAPDPKSRR